MSLSPTILVVEDDEDVSDAVRDSLEDAGYTVIVAENGVRAMDALRSAEARPCLILLDLMMPVMNGEEFLQELQRDPSYATLPIVLLTADGSAAKKAARLNVAGGLRKPVQLRELLSAVATHCPQGWETCE
jgi:CheY-like chemotaxis protein